MAAQGERELGDIDIGEGLLDPVAQDIPEQDIVMGELELPPQMDPEPQMGAAAAEAAVYDTSPSLLRNPPPIPAETARPSALDIIVQALNRMENNMNKKMQGLNNEINGMNEMKEEIKNNTNEMREEMKEMRGEMRQVGQCLQAGKRAMPSAATNELNGECTGG